MTENDFKAIWKLFVQKTYPKKGKELRPLVNLLGSIKQHEKLFLEACKDHFQKSIWDD